MTVGQEANAGCYRYAPHCGIAPDRLKVRLCASCFGGFAVNAGADLLAMCTPWRMLGNDAQCSVEMVAWPLKRNFDVISCDRLRSR